MKHFWSSIILTVIGLSVAFYIGGLTALYIVTLLGILEISLSFDNAVVNAKVLEGMSKEWQQRFLTYGMVIAVFGMRFVFPILIVAIASGLPIGDTLNLALNKPLEYHETLVSVEKLIFAFGGSFLLMVFLNFILDKEREEKWIKSIEESHIIMRMGKISYIHFIVASIIGVALFFLKDDYTISLAYFVGVILYALISSLDSIFDTNGVKSGLIGFLYLEILDASFSFDGVIGAFALSSDIFIIMIGLGMGAMFVRSLTLYMVEKKTLVQYRYLEHGAHYAILALAFIMLIKIFYHVDEIIVGTVGILFIAISLYHSIQMNKIPLKVES